MFGNKPAWLALAAFISLPSALVAADSAVVPSGKPTGIMAFSKTTSACEDYGKPKTSVITAPKHGNVEFAWLRLKMKKGRCKGETIRIVGVYYKSNAGYHGEDYFKVGFGSPYYEDGSGSSYDIYGYTITVK